MIKKKFFTEKRIAFLARWWSAGAVYFFIAWGTTIGQYSYIDLAFFLGIFIGLFYMLIVNPVLRGMLNLEFEVKYVDTTVFKLILYRLGELLKSIVIVAMIVYIYDVSNQILIAKMELFIPGEPILFGLLYVLLYMLLDKIKQIIVSRRK